MYSPVTKLVRQLYQNTACLAETGSILIHDGSRSKNQNTYCIQITAFGSVADPDPGFGVFLPLDHGSGMEKKSGSGIRDEHPRSFFRELINSFGAKNT
jgi:hypothetical protein